MLKEGKNFHIKKIRNFSNFYSSIESESLELKSLEF